MRILIVEDDASVAHFVRAGLEQEHYAVDTAEDGEQGRDMCDGVDYDLVILDLGLPKVDGLSVLRHIRELKPNLPVLVLTAKGDVEQRVATLDGGADDYLSKPFSFSELAARVRVLLRRGKQATSTELKVADLVLDRVQRRVRRGSRVVDLTSKEFALLEYLMRNAGRRVTRSMIIEHVWNIGFDTTTNIVDVYVNYLRKKIDSDSEAKLIRTVRGVGYELAEPSAEMVS